MGNETNNATQMPMPDCMEAPRPTLSKVIRKNNDVVVELAYERREISKNLSNLEKAIEANHESVSELHNDLWRKQAEAMRTYKDVLGERIKDLWRKQAESTRTYKDVLGERIKDLIDG